MEKLFLFSGLGADKRVYAPLLHHLGLNDAADGYQKLTARFEFVHIEWLPPGAAESLSCYVQRLANHYQIPKEGAKVIGVSFGGMCISELSKTYNFGKIVLISSAKNKYELPKSLPLSKFFPLHRLIPDRYFLQPTMLLNWLFTLGSTEEKQLLAEIVKDSDPKFLRWAINCIVNWDHTSIPLNCMHIHGDMDRVIPIQNVDYSIKIARAGHFMILNKAAEIAFSVKNYLY
ncbi:hypothetical protein ACL9RF_12970 [Sphingobacterium sp. Mn56C]|uniref:hypothetical protein n=1 Tax=Sphingobacterium sp. Mn56C TaxID=3395261 RepID=UPI003BD85A65